MSAAAGVAVVIAIALAVVHEVLSAGGARGATSRLAPLTATAAVVAVAAIGWRIFELAL